MWSETSSENHDKATNVAKINMQLDVIDETEQMLAQIINVHNMGHYPLWKALNYINIAQNHLKIARQNLRFMLFANSSIAPKLAQLTREITAINNFATYIEAGIRSYIGSPFVDCNFTSWHSPGLFCFKFKTKDLFDTECMNERGVAYFLGETGITPKPELDYSTAGVGW